MSIPSSLKDRLTLPLIGAPMFIVSGPALVIEQCKAGIVGSMPSLNARPLDLLEPWLVEIRTALDAHARLNPGARVAPFAVNLISHPTNVRLAHDLDVCVRQQVPIVITSLGVSQEIIVRVHGYGGLVFHDVTNMRHARKAIDSGVDGIIAVCAGAAGHAGTLSPFGLVRELRQIYDGTIALSGAISDGSGILAALAMGADLAYMGTRFIATKESSGFPDYKAQLLESDASDVVYTPYFSGVPANYLRSSISRAGMDPDNLPGRDAKSMSFAAGSSSKAWKDIWAAGHGVGVIRDIPSVEELVARLRAEYQQAFDGLASKNLQFQSRSEMHWTPHPQSA